MDLPLMLSLTFFLLYRNSCGIAGNVGAMRLFCPAENYQVTTTLHGQNGVLARVSSWRFLPSTAATKHKKIKAKGWEFEF